MSKLLEQVKTTARLRHLILKTEKVYLQQIKRIILFLGKQHPRELARTIRSKGIVQRMNGNSTAGQSRRRTSRGRSRNHLDFTFEAKPMREMSGRTSGASHSGLDYNYLLEKIPIQSRSWRNELSAVTTSGGTSCPPANGTQDT